MLRRFVALTLCLVLFMNHRLLAWSAGGHKIVARIAWARLTPDKRKVISDLIRHNPRFDDDFVLPGNFTPNTDEGETEWLFTQAAVWPDLIRDNVDFNHDPWHYINQPVFLTDNDRNALEATLRVNLRTEIPAMAEFSEMNAVQTLKFCLQVLNDQNADDTEKGIYICWLIHLTGDLAQPLHSSAMFSRVAFPRGDKGGNFIPTDSGKLHGYWDGLLGKNIPFNDVRNRAAQVLMDPLLFTTGEMALEDLNPEKWVNESHELCEMLVYSTEIRTAIERRELGLTSQVAETVLSAAYKQEAGKIARLQIARAGFRLGSLLEKIAAAQTEVTLPATEIKITGVLPDPIGRDSIGEVIRIKNLTPQMFTITGWIVRDDDGDELVLQGTLATGQEQDIVDISNDLPLSNSGDTIELVSPSGAVMQRFEYLESQVSQGVFIDVQ